ncbi:MAG TPA: Crp/Fnr family transcriptional regulator [Terriglobales bacterium]
MEQAIQNRNDLLKAFEDYGAHTEKMKLSPGDMLYKHGASAEGVFFITSGKMRIFVPVDNRLIEIEEVGPGQCLALPAVISGNNSEISSVAETVVKGVFISKEEVTAALLKYPHLYLVINSYLSEALCSVYRHIRNIRLNAQVACWSQSASR